MTHPSHVTQVLEKLRAIRDAKLPAPQKAILFAIATRLNEEFEAWPSITRLAKDAGLSRRWVSENVAELAELGWLDVRTGEGRRSNRYRVIHTPEGRSLARARVVANRVRHKNGSGEQSASLPCTPCIRSGEQSAHEVTQEVTHRREPNVENSGTARQRELGYAGSELESIRSQLGRLQEETEHIGWRELHGRRRRADKEAQRKVAGG